MKEIPQSSGSSRAANLAAFMLPALVVIGPAFATTFSTSAVKVLLMALIFVVGLRRLTTLTVGTIILTTLAFSITVGAFGVVGAMWAADSALAINALTALAMALFAIIGALGGAIDTRFRNALISGWVIAFSLVVIGTFYEVISGRRFDNYLVGVEVGQELDMAASTMGNPNALATFMIISFPLLALRMQEANSRGPALLYAVAILGGFASVVLSGSRLGLLSAILVIAILAILIGERALGLLGALFGVAFIAFLTFSAWAKFVPDKLYYYIPEVAEKGLLGAVDDSGEQRIELYRSAIVFIRDSAGLGIGPGQFASWLTEGKSPFWTGDVLAPHNAFLEIGAEYGLLALILFVSLLAALGGRSLRIRSRGPEAKLLGSAVMAGLVGLIMTSFLNSAFIPNTILWIWIGLAGGMLCQGEMKSLRLEGR